jgi:hypothetical protein
MKILRVLSLDGGGMRGLYTAAYLDCLASAFEKRRKVRKLDIGKAFDLIVGTSTGAIVGCAIAAGTPLNKICELYSTHGKEIFPARLPEGPVTAMLDLNSRSKALEKGAGALRAALTGCFGNTTLGQLYKSRQIALAIPAIEMAHHQSFVFKTPHLAGSMHRDNDYSLVDVCLATSAAPIYRALAALDNPDNATAFRVFADGGLWANNPVLVALIDALGMTSAGDQIEIYCMGTCPRPSGDFISKTNLNWGLSEWKFGGNAAALAMDAQEFAYDNMARLLAPHLDRACQIMRFPRGDVPGQMMQFLDLDNTSPEAAQALIAQAHRDAEMTNSRTNDSKDYEGKLVYQLFTDMPVL